MKLVVLAAVIALVQAGTIPERRDLSKVLLRTPVVGGTKDNPIVTFPEVYMGDAEGRIIGGTVVSPHSVPHQAGLFLSVPGGTAFCGGSLIRPNAVLTAAHCCDGARSVEVVLGAHDISITETTQQSFISTDLRPHRQYNQNSLANDICIIALPQNAVLNSNVQTINLEGDATNTHEGQTATITGWGKISDAATGITDLLRTVNVPVISNTQCANVYGNIVTASHICTSTSGGKGSCNGDSGGPLKLSISGQLTEIGIVSFGSSSGCTAAPSAFTRVGSFSSWISSNLP